MSKVGFDDQALLLLLKNVDKSKMSESERTLVDGQEQQVKERLIKAQTKKLLDTAVEQTKKNVGNYIEASLKTLSVPDALSSITVDFALDAESGKFQLAKWKVDYRFDAVFTSQSMSLVGAIEHYIKGLPKTHQETFETTIANHTKYGMILSAMKSQKNVEPFTTKTLPAAFSASLVSNFLDGVELPADTKKAGSVKIEHSQVETEEKATWKVVDCKLGKSGRGPGTNGRIKCPEGYSNWEDYVIINFVGDGAKIKKDETVTKKFNDHGRGSSSWSPNNELVRIEKSLPVEQQVYLTAQKAKNGSTEKKTEV